MRFTQIANALDLCTASANCRLYRPKTCSWSLEHVFLDKHSQGVIITLFLESHAGYLMNCTLLFYVIFIQNNMVNDYRIHPIRRLMHTGVVNPKTPMPISKTTYERTSGTLVIKLTKCCTNSKGINFKNHNKTLV